MCAYKHKTVGATLFKVTPLFCKILRCKERGENEIVKDRLHCLNKMLINVLQ